MHVHPGHGPACMPAVASATSGVGWQLARCDVGCKKGCLAYIHRFGDGTSSDRINNVWCMAFVCVRPSLTLCETTLGGEPTQGGEPILGLWASVRLCPALQWHLPPRARPS
jgi:hypothetical protein